MKRSDELVGHGSSFAEPPSFVDPVHRDVLGHLTNAVKSMRNHYQLMSDQQDPYLEYESSVLYDVEMALLTFVGIISPFDDEQQKSILEHYSLGDLWISPQF